MADIRDLAFRRLRLQDVEVLTRYLNSNREHLRATQPLRDDAWFDQETQLRALRVEEAQFDAGSDFAFAGILDGEVVARVALTGIARGAFCNAHVGYSVDHRLTGQDIATLGLRFAVDYAFENGLHRVQAAVSNDNAASLRVLEKTGFRYEGLALRYLKLDGQWTDQQLHALTAEEWPISQPSAIGDHRLAPSE